MTDREVVITHLDDLRLFADVTVHPAVSPDNWNVYASLCDYIDQIKTEVKILLKEQEAVKPKIDAFGHQYCPKCKILVYETWEFCPHCGQAVTWNA